jgi:predicted nucleic acid-binding protein
VIVLDTNVVSELMRMMPSPAVLRWIARQNPLDCYTTSITQAEILHGVRQLAAGARRRRIEEAAEATFRENFAGRILAFDSPAARAYANIVTDRRRQGRPISHFDAQIGAIAQCARATLATRNAKDFEYCGMEVLNPWDLD